MKQKVLVFTAWPYANGPIHLGHIAGCYLPADIFARFCRTKGKDVVMLSGSDQHGTPITVKAENEGVTPEEIAERYHRSFMESWEKFGISYTFYTKTTTENHRETVQELFLDLLQKGYIYKNSMRLPYCNTCTRFLPDRYVEGSCPYCESAGARGDQCDDCGKTLDPEDLVDPRCKFCSTKPVIQDSEHFFLKLSAFNDRLLDWIKTRDYFRPNVYAFTKRYLEEGLKDRAITRDISWGVPVPLEGYEDKRIYVWFEAVIGYLSAAKEWAKQKGEPDCWEDYWKDPDCESYYFIGKDNIPFHTIIWPAMLMGYNHGMQLPYNVPANEYLTIEGRQLSTSRNWAVWLPDYLERYEPDPMRYALSINMPETSDTDFSWNEYYRRNNHELVATYGNLIHRTLSFTHKRFDGKIPDPGELAPEDKEILALSAKTLSDMDEQLSRCSFREALRTAMNLAHEANKYLEVSSPWMTIKEDRDRAGTSLWVVIQLINTLKTALYPYLPFSSEKLHKILGYEDSVEKHGWMVEELQGGREFNQPEPLFRKLEESMVEEEVERMKESGRME
jgi:methionyl-tRNA synthetase